MITLSVILPPSVVLQVTTDVLERSESGSWSLTPFSEITLRACMYVCMCVCICVRVCVYHAQSLTSARTNLIVYSVTGSNPSTVNIVGDPTATSPAGR